MKWWLTEGVNGFRHCGPRLLESGLSEVDALESLCRGNHTAAGWTTVSHYQEENMEQVTAVVCRLTHWLSSGVRIGPGTGALVAFGVCCGQMYKKALLLGYYYVYWIVFKWKGMTHVDTCLLCPLFFQWCHLAEQFLSRIIQIATHWDAAYRSPHIHKKIYASSDQMWRMNVKEV